ncbi:MAG: ribosome recycling factor [bacterium]
MLDQVFQQTEQKMKQILKNLQGEFKSVRTGRATSAMFENINVNYYGSATPMNQLAKIQVPDAKQVVIQPYDAGSLEDIEKAIMESDLGLTPNNDGEIIRIQIPDLTEERRKELAGVVKEYAEDAKIEIRKIRREARDEVSLYENEGEISEDDAHRARERIQEITDQHEDMVDELLEKKTEEIMSF